MSTVMLQETDASWRGLFQRFASFVTISTANQFAVFEKTAEQEESFPTEEVMRVVETSIANMNAGRLSEPVNERARHLFELLADELDED